MALQSKELFASSSVNPFPRAKPTMVMTKKIKAIAGAPTLAILTPMAANTSTGIWEPWVDSGTNGVGTISGFIYPVAHATHATNETIGTIMLAGEIHHDDVPTYNSGAQNLLTAALKNNLGAKGIFVQGVTAAY